MAFLILSSCNLCSPPRKGRIGSLARKPSFSRYLRDARIKRRLSVVEVGKQVGVARARPSIFGKRITLDHGMRI